VNIADGRLDADLLRFYDHELDYRDGNRETTLTLNGKRLVSASCWWDPSYGSPTGGDASVIAAVFTDDGGDYWLQRIAYLQHDPALVDEAAEAVQMCRQVVAFVRDLYLPSVTIETNGIGRFLPGLLRSEFSASGLAAAVVEKASSKSKDQRIIDAFDAVLAAGRLHANRSVWDTPLIAEMREWRPSTKGPDDGLDAVSGCLLAEPVRLPKHAEMAGKRHNWRAAPGGFKAETDFSF
ncbi:MAG: phage terminase large subunit, partial [Alphaproteobacteria bacterium]